MLSDMVMLKYKKLFPLFVSKKSKEKYNGLIQVNYLTHEENCDFTFVYLNPFKIIFNVTKFLSLH